MSQSTARSFPFRPISAGMGQAVAERTILRKKENGEFEDWGDVANRVARGNANLFDGPIHSSETEYHLLRKHIANGNTLMSGRHLQHGDENQPTRNMEVFTNCATSSASFLLFYLLLNGSGVGRCYDDDMILVNWDYAPSLRCVLDSSHPDFNYSAHESVRDAIHKYGKEGPNVMWYEVPDSREGWAKALEIWENAAFEKIHAGKMLILDFSKVRARGLPIKGMQNRPASGPVALMDAFEKAAKLKGAGLAPWRQAIYLDHYFAECVLVGGARRAARMSTKHWSDPTIFDFITIKRPLEFHGKNAQEILEYRKTEKANAFLWSSNNSVTVDDEFWELVRDPSNKTPRAKHAKKVFKLVCTAAYADGTGEPGLINSHKLVQKDDGWNDLNRGDYVGSKKYQINDDTQILMSRLAKRAKKKKYHTITNPCGEIALNVLGGFCVIADVVPFHCNDLEEAEECFRVVTRALMRVNLMDSIYSKEVQRTNRIGVGMTGVHEFAYKFFGFGFKDLIDEEKSKPFWMQMAKFNNIVHEEAVAYAKELGVKPPHTETTIKPAGTTSKLFLLTEGWHLPTMEYFLRWVQFRNDDPLVETYKAAGYPVRKLTHYTGTTIVGFPTEPTITTLGMGDKLVTAAHATPEEQFKWLMLGEKYWIHGVTPDGKTVEESNGNQISYTLKYKPDLVDFDHFRKMIMKYQSQVRCCAVMPQEDTSCYEYQPEEAVDFETYAAIVKKIERAAIVEDIGREHVGCDNGACPVDFNSGRK